MAGGLGNGSDKEADGASAEDEDSGECGQIGAIVSMHCDRERLDKGAELERDVLGEFVTPLGGMVKALLQSTLGVWEGLSRAPELHGRADVVTALEAEAAALAGLADLHCDAVTHNKPCDVRANGSDYAGRLMTEGQGFADWDVTDGVVVVIMEVRATETCRLGGYLDLANGGRIYGTLSLEEGGPSAGLSCVSPDITRGVRTYQTKVPDTVEDGSLYPLRHGGVAGEYSYKPPD